MRIGKSIFRFPGILLLSLFLFPGTKGGIKGEIIDSNKNPIEGVKVIIISVDYPSERYNLKTDKKGEFIQIGLEAGYYQIQCEKEGYSPIGKRVKVSISEIFETTITLERQKQQTVKEVPGREEMRKANKLFQEGKYEEALKEYQEAVNENPEDATGYYNIGVTYIILEKPDEAIEAFKGTIEIQPGNYEALKNLGQLYGEKKNYEESSKYYSLALKISSDDPEVFYNLGVCLMNLGNPTGAMDAFQKSIERQEDYADSYYQLGLLYLNQNKMEEAQAVLEKFLQIAPDDSKAPNVKKIIELIKRHERQSECRGPDSNRHIG
ncbi:MAG: tetratricopeptide repeat protein [Candidatus Aminicenantes bacterium]|nr:MAG: tetratricopeptide repeat protein [Candidatus Aminicenantes bacterium]